MQPALPFDFSTCLHDALQFPAVMARQQFHERLQHLAGIRLISSMPAVCHDG
jgi:hypothetical protein